MCQYKDIKIFKMFFRGNFGRVRDGGIFRRGAAGKAPGGFATR